MKNNLNKYTYLGTRTETHVDINRVISKLYIAYFSYNEDIISLKITKIYHNNIHIDTTKEYHHNIYDDKSNDLISMISKEKFDLDNFVEYDSYTSLSDVFKKYKIQRRIDRINALCSL